MDKKTLYRLFWLNKMIDQKNRDIRRIMERLTSVSPSLTGMPHTGGVHDKIGEGVAELVDKKRELEAVLRGYIEEEARISSWIDSVEDLQVQLAITLRFRERMSWNEVADQLGGGNTEDSCRKLVDRYLEKGERNDGKIC